MIDKVLIKNIFLIIVCVFKLGCNSDNTISPSNNKLKFIGFEDKIPVEIIWSAPYLYACAGRDGLWRKEINSKTDWEYLGLANDSLSKNLPRGVLGADILENDIIVAYNESEDFIQPDKSVGIWRSTNSGKEWFRSDNGIPQTITSQYEYNTISAVRRSPHNNSILFSIVAPAIYKSDDNGYNWKLVMSQRGFLQSYGNLKFNPNSKGEVWFFGESSIMSPFLFCTKDFGKTFGNNIDFSANFDFYSDNLVTDVCFDANNPNIIYAVTAQGIIKSLDDGINWFLINPNLSEGSFIKMLESTHSSNELYALGGHQIFYSIDGLKTIKLISNIPDASILSSDIDFNDKILFIGTTKGIYTLRIE